MLWIVLAAAVTWYVSMMRRVQRRTGKPVGAGHWLPYFSGIAVLFIALDSPIDAIGDSWLLMAHMIQHVLIADIAPPLLILGLRAPVLPLGMPRSALRWFAPAAGSGASGASPPTPGSRCPRGSPRPSSGRFRRCSTSPLSTRCCTSSST